MTVTVSKPQQTILPQEKTQLFIHNWFLLIVFSLWQSCRLTQNWDERDYFCC